MALGHECAPNLGDYFLEGHRVDLNVRSDGVSDMDLYVYFGKNLLHKDEAFNSNPRLSFVASKSGAYRVKVWNRLVIPNLEHRNGQNNGVFTFRQFDVSKQAKAIAAREQENDPVEAEKDPPAKNDPPEAKKNSPPVKKASEPPPQANTANPPVEKEDKTGQKPKGEPAMVDKDQPKSKAAPSQPRVLLEFQGNLAAKKGGSRNPHDVPLQAGVSYLFELNSTAFDTILEVRDSQGRLLTLNNNVSAENKNSRIVFEPKQAGTYQLIVRAFGINASGPYRLTVSGK